MTQKFSQLLTLFQLFEPLFGNFDHIFFELEHFFHFIFIFRILHIFQVLFKLTLPTFFLIFQFLLHLLLLLTSHIFTISFFVGLRAGQRTCLPQTPRTLILRLVFAILTQTFLCLFLTLGHILVSLKLVRSLSLAEFVIVGSSIIGRRAILGVKSSSHDSFLFIIILILLIIDQSNFIYIYK